MFKIFKYRIMLIFLILILFSISSSFAENVPVDELVSKAMDQTLLEMNNPSIKIIKQGSWISKENFRPYKPDVPLERLSDYDARLFIADDIEPEKALGVWKKFRLKLHENIIKMAKKAGYSSDDFGKIRSLVNFYPPEQFLKNISSKEAALKLFNTSGIYPNLGEVGDEAAEGLHGRLTKFLRQAFETESRVQVSELIIENGVYKVIHKATAIMEHALEGIAPKNLTGFIQASEHALSESKKALRAGNYVLAEKQLKRMNGYLKEARKLVNTSTEGELLEKIDSLEKVLNNLKNKVLDGGMEASELIKHINNIAKKLKPIEAELLLETNAIKGLKEAKNPRTRYLLKGLIENDKAFSTLKTNLVSLSDDAISKGLNKEFALWFGTTLLDFWNLKQLDEAIKKGEVGISNIVIPSLLNYLFPPTTPFGWATLFTEVYVTIMSLAIQYVESTGYSALIKDQDCMDLIAGIYTMKGREHRTMFQKCEEITDSHTLACRIYDHHGLRRYESMTIMA